MSKTAQELRLDYYALKKRVESAGAKRLASSSRTSSQKFVEIPL